jgi:uncharacterized cupredoxin-like copper-binding protein
MKKTLEVSALFLSSLSLAAFANGTGVHAHGAARDDHASAIGKPGNPAEVTRTMMVDMNDAMRFIPATIDVKRGETVKFIVRNSGRLKHEMVLGTMQELKAHAEVMRQHPEMEHADENQVSVDPGKTGEIVWQFTNAGTFDFACLQPGHFEAGMKGAVVVK